jgi:hypothetical protein
MLCYSKGGGIEVIPAAMGRGLGLMKRLLALLGIWQLVWTRDKDHCSSDVRLRKVRNHPFGGLCVSGICGGDAILMEDGTTKGIPYIDCWIPWEYNLRKLRIGSRSQKSDGFRSSSFATPKKPSIVRNPKNPIQFGRKRA